MAEMSTLDVSAFRTEGLSFSTWCLRLYVRRIFHTILGRYHTTLMVNLPSSMLYDFIEVGSL